VRAVVVARRATTPVARQCRDLGTPPWTALGVSLGNRDVVHGVGERSARYRASLRRTFTPENNRANLRMKDKWARRPRHDDGGQQANARDRVHYTGFAGDRFWLPAETANLTGIFRRRRDFFWKSFKGSGRHARKSRKRVANRPNAAVC